MGVPRLALGMTTFILIKVLGKKNNNHYEH